MSPFVVLFLAADFWLSQTLIIPLFCQSVVYRYNDSFNQEGTVSTTTLVNQVALAQDTTSATENGTLATRHIIINRKGSNGQKNKKSVVAVVA